MDSGIFSLTPQCVLPGFRSKILQSCLRFEKSAPGSRLPFLLVRRFRFAGGAAVRVKAKASPDGRDGLSPWDDKPYELLPGGRRTYLDEQDVVSFLDPPKELIPIDAASYNPAAYLWKKIGDIPEERRCRLLHTVKDRLISKLWELAGTRYRDAKLAKQNSSSLLSLEENLGKMESWNCRTSQAFGVGPLPISWLKDFRKVIFCGKNGSIYGLIILGGPFQFAYKPLYFKVRQVMEVMSTEQPCDLAYEFEDEILSTLDSPEGFPRPEKLPWPFNDHMVIYLRHAGPGILVGQAWLEGKDLEQVPKKFCGEIFMVKDYSASGR